MGLEHGALILNFVALLLQLDRFRVQLLLLKGFDVHWYVHLARSVIFGETVRELGQVRSLGRLNALADVRQDSWVTTWHWVGRDGSTSFGASLV